VSKPNYVCSLCKKDFSRKSNANRHDLNQHRGLAEIVRVGDYVLREKSFFAKTKYRNDRLSNIDPKEARLFDILEKLVPRFEEMERALSHCSPEEKQRIGGQTITHAISSPDPVHYMTRYVDSIRKGRSIPAMINCVALWFGVSRTTAQEILKNMIV
jgi:hypothetical protein